MRHNHLTGKEAFLIEVAKRYDVKGRKHIGSLMKYYFEDIGLVKKSVGAKAGR